jgi:hypothetical protein
MEVEVISNFCVVLKLNMQASLPFGKNKNTTSLTLFFGGAIQEQCYSDKKGV